MLFQVKQIEANRSVEREGWTDPAAIQIDAVNNIRSVLGDEKGSVRKLIGVFDRQPAGIAGGPGSPEAGTDLVAYIAISEIPDVLRNGESVVGVKEVDGIAIEK